MIKLEDIVEEKTWVYRLFCHHIYIPIAAFTLFFYFSAYGLSLFNLDFSGAFYHFLFGKKLSEFKESTLLLTEQVKSFILISNLCVFIGPLVFLKIIAKFKIKKVSLTKEIKINILKNSCGIILFIFLFVLVIYMTPYSENIWGDFFFYNEFMYYFAASSFFSVIFFSEFIAFCYLKLVFQQSNGDKI